MARRVDSCITPESLVYWYLRINGFLLLENFVVHPDVGAQQRTDADLLGVRFMHRHELLIDPMEDDLVVSECSTLCNVVIAEVKRGQCALNGPWTNQNDKNMLRILRAIGCFDENLIGNAAEDLYKEGRYQDEHVTCRILAFGDSKGKLPIAGVQQILFIDVIKFIHSRFRKYSEQKASVGNWAEDGQQLKTLAERYCELSEFECEARRLFQLPEQIRKISQ